MHTTINHHYPSDYAPAAAANPFVVQRPASSEKRRPKRRRSAGAAIGLALAVAAAAFVPNAVAAGLRQERSPLFWLQDDRTGEVGRGAQTTLRRFDRSVSVDVHARHLEPGHAYTVWFVVFNDPGGCVDGCGEDDFERPEADASVVWSGASGVANGGGALNAHGRLAVGDPTPDGQQVLFGPGLTDSRTTEIHFVVRDHGPASDDATTRTAQLTTFEGGCTPESSFGLGSGSYACVDPQASVHLAG